MVHYTYRGESGSIIDRYEMKAGRWPANGLIIVVRPHNKILRFICQMCGVKPRIIVVKP